MSQSYANSCGHAALVPVRDPANDAGPVPFPFAVYAERHDGRDDPLAKGVHYDEVAPPPYQQLPTKHLMSTKVGFKENHYEGGDVIKCAACNARPNDSILFPCGHRIVCTVCASTTSTCLVCDQTVTHAEQYNRDNIYDNAAQCISSEPLADASITGIDVSKGLPQLSADARRKLGLYDSKGRPIHGADASATRAIRVIMPEHLIDQAYVEHPLASDQPPQYLRPGAVIEDGGHHMIPANFSPDGLVYAGVPDVTEYDGSEFHKYLATGQRSAPVNGGYMAQLNAYGPSGGAPPAPPAAMAPRTVTGRSVSRSVTTPAGSSVFVPILD